MKNRKKSPQRKHINKSRATGGFHELIRRAHVALTTSDQASAVDVAQKLIEFFPDRAEGYMIMGACAVERLEGTVAVACYERAHRLDPQNFRVLTGLAKAYLVSVEPLICYEHLKTAVDLGETSLDVLHLLLDLSGRISSTADCATHLYNAAKRGGTIEHYLLAANTLVDAFRLQEAIEMYDLGWKLSPHSFRHKKLLLRKLITEVKVPEAFELAESMLREAPLDEDLLSDYLIIARLAGEFDRALAAYEAKLNSVSGFTNTEEFARCLSVMATIYQDMNNAPAADKAYQATMLLEQQDKMGLSKSAYAVFLMREREYDKARALWNLRNLPRVSRVTNMGRYDFRTNKPDTGRIFLLPEQGVGDALAIAPLYHSYPQTGSRLVFTGERRITELFRHNKMDIKVECVDDLAKLVKKADDSVAYIGDIITYNITEPGIAGYLAVDDETAKRLLNDYRSRFGARPLIGAAWKTNNIVRGFRRVISPTKLLDAFPHGAVVINLQYGDSSDMAEAIRQRPDLTFYNDPTVDQMESMEDFVAQISVLDAVVTIDNTTLHAAGAVGHPHCYGLIPAGAECMWYWKSSGPDTWYGNLHLMRQKVVGDWSDPVKEIRRTLDKITQ